MKSISYCLLILLLCCSGVSAQEGESVSSASRLDELLGGAMAMEASGIRMPYYDEEGNLHVQLFGGHIKQLEGRRGEITNLRIDVYEKGAIAMTVFAPQCFARFVEQGGETSVAIESEGEVLVETDQMTITGLGFRFSSRGNRFEILSDSKVLVKESARNAEALEP